MVKIIGNLEAKGNIQSSGLSQKFTNTLSYTLPAGVTTSNVNLSALTNVHTIKINNTGLNYGYFDGRFCDLTCALNCMSKIQQILI